eukprot:GGOE01053783.1.p1 GENE.GGOE01053783.1~~GGOE01053783.1.p1  ORF type:complete len:943 (-),score=232.62 GGOE01053783.1:171-2660(-)
MPTSITLLKVKAAADMEKTSESNGAPASPTPNTLWERRLSRSPKALDAAVRRLKQVKLLDTKHGEDTVSREGLSRELSRDGTDITTRSSRAPKAKTAKGKAAKGGKAADDKDGGPCGASPKAHTPHLGLSDSILGNSVSQPALHCGKTQLLFPTFVECLLRVAQHKFRYTGGHIWVGDAQRGSALEVLQTLFETHLCFLTDCLKQVARANLPGLPPFTGEPMPNITFEASRKPSKKRLRRQEHHDANGVLDSPQSQGSITPLAISALRKRASADRTKPASTSASRRSTAISPTSSLAPFRTTLGSLPGRIAVMPPLALGRSPADSLGRTHLTNSRGMGIPSSARSARSYLPEGPHMENTGVSTTSIPLYDISHSLLADEPVVDFDVVEVAAPPSGTGFVAPPMQRLYAQHLTDGNGVHMTFLGLELQRKVGNRPSAVRHRMKAMPVVRVLQQRGNVPLLVWEKYKSPRRAECMSLRYFLKFLADYQLLPAFDANDEPFRAQHRKSQAFNWRKSGHNGPQGLVQKIAFGPGQPTPSEPPPTEFLLRRPRVSRLVARLVGELFEEDVNERILANPDYSDCPPPQDSLHIAASGVSADRNHEAQRDALTSAGGTSVDLASEFSHDFYEDRPLTTSGKVGDDPKRPSLVERTSNDAELPPGPTKCLSFWIDPGVEAVEKPNPASIKQAWVTASRLEKFCWTWDYVYGDLEMLYPQFLEAICIVAETTFPKSEPGEPPAADKETATGIYRARPSLPPTLEASDVFGLRNRLNDLLDWLENPPPLPRPRTPSPPPLRLPPPLPRKKLVPQEAEPAKVKGRATAKSAPKPAAPKKK